MVVNLSIAFSLYLLSTDLVTLILLGIQNVFHSRRLDMVYFEVVVGGGEGEGEGGGCYTWIWFASLPCINSLRFLAR